MITEKTKPEKAQRKEKTGKPKSSPEYKVSVILDVTTLKSVIEQASTDAKFLGFQDGVKYIVTLAEDFMAEHLKLSSRDKLREDIENIPTWWIATLVTALHYEPPYDKKKEVKNGNLG